MITRIGFAPVLPHLSIPEAQAHWAGPHASVSLTMPGVMRYWQNHAVLNSGMPLLPWAGFDCCSEFDFANAAEMDAAFASDAYFTNVRPDEQQLLDKSKGGMLIAERYIVGGNVADAAYRLMRFHRQTPLRPLAQVKDALLALPQSDVTVAREIYIALDGGQTGQRAPMFDAVEIDWFACADDALRYALSAEQRERRSTYAHLVRGTDHLIARVNRVTDDPTAPIKTEL